jgi:hypothetical protein
MIRTMRRVAKSNWLLALVLVGALSLAVSCSDSDSGSDDGGDPAGECEVGDCADDAGKQDICETATEVCRTTGLTQALEDLCVDGAILDACGAAGPG